MANSYRDEYEKVWKVIESSKGSQQYFTDFNVAMGILFQNNRLTFEHSDNSMPKQCRYNRSKWIHPKGVVTKCEFVPVGSEYTGLFKGAKYGIVRLSNAKGPFESIPGIAIKFFRNNWRSGDIIAMYDLAGQNTCNFFENVLSNHVCPPSSVPLKILEGNFKFASKYTTKLGLSDFARYTEDGIEEKDVRFPFQLFFEPSREAKNRIDSIISKLSEPYDLVDILDNFDFSNLVLYNVYAKDAPGSVLKPTVDDIKKSSSIKLIGVIKIGDSKFIKSLYADTTLFFRHTSMEDDLEYKPEWGGTIRVNQT
jgi:hypothetical protein